MRLNDLIRQAGEWLRGDGPDGDIVISSRVRLARNLGDYPFVLRCTDGQLTEIEQQLCESIRDVKIGSPLTYFGLAGCSNVDRKLLVERHLISREHSEGSRGRGVAVDGDETVSVMVNEEDHLRLQAIRSGFRLADTWALINDVDNQIESRADYAFSPQFGYLTACPTNVGTGMRVSVMLHLPALEMTKHMEKVLNAVSKINLVVRGLYGEGTQASGNFYQVSNQITLGKSEEEILNNVEKTVPQIILYERHARDALVEQNRKLLEDKVWRALGMLRTARIISSSETLALLSHLRLGINLGLISDLDLSVVNELFILTQPAHLQKLAGSELDTPERDIARADLIRDRLGEL